MIKDLSNYKHCPKCNELKNNVGHYLVFESHTGYEYEIEACKDCIEALKDDLNRENLDIIHL